MPVVPSNTFLNANLKELEVSGSIKLGNKTITKLLDSADVSSISGNGGGGIDSAATIALIDSAYVQARQTTVGSSGTDSATVINLIDSAHVQLRQTPQDFSYSSLTGTPSLVSNFTNDANYLDSTTVTGVIDAVYIQSNQTTYDFLDSSEAITLIDSAYVQARQITYDFLDSSEAIALIDSSYVQARQTIYTNANFADSAFVTTQINNLIDGAPGTLDTLNEIAAALNDDDSAYNTLVTLIGTKSDLDSADAINLIDSGYVQARQITYDFLDSSEAINLIDSGYVQARQITYDFLDSSEAIALIDSSYVQARQITYDFLDSSEAINLIDSGYIETRRPAETIFNIINNGASAYTFSGDGFPSSVNNPTIYLTRGKTYKFAVNASGHPFLIRLSSGGSSYSDGVINNGAQTGNVIFTVPMNAPNTLVYQCQYHSGMVGDIKIFNEDSFLDSSDAISLVDSAYVQSRQITYDFLDSSEVISLIDSAYVQARQTSGGGGAFDSAAAIELIDSAYVQARQTSGGGGGSSVTSSDAAPSSPSAGDLWYDTTDGTLNIYYNDGSSSQWVSISSYASGGSTNSYVEATSSITALVNKKYIVDTSSAITITLPSSPSLGDEIKVIDGTNNAGTNNITINRNSNKILGADSDFIIDVNRTAVDLVYYNTTQGWIISGNT